MNKIILMGRLVRDPEAKYSGNTAVAKFSLAVDRKYKKDGEPTADFFNCVSFGKQAEFVDKYLHKGIKIVLIGRLQNDNYTDRNGNKVYAVNVIAEEIEFAESKNTTNQQNNGAQYITYQDY